MPIQNFSYSGSSNTSFIDGTEPETRNSKWWLMRDLMMLGGDLYDTIAGIAMVKAFDTEKTGDYFSLPWQDEYWMESESNYLQPNFDKLYNDIEVISSEIEAHNALILEQDGEYYEPYTYQLELTNKRQIVQALAVESLLYADQAIGAAIEERYLEAGLLTSTAYKGSIQCTANIQILLGISSIAGRVGAYKIHEENRAMKAQVFEWCTLNLKSFSGSLDDAAIEISKKLVPMKFSTVRAWITEWRKLQSRPRPD
jgi:hypothetical protein